MPCNNLTEWWHDYVFLVNYLGSISYEPFVIKIFRFRIMMINDVSGFGQTFLKRCKQYQLVLFSHGGQIWGLVIPEQNISRTPSLVASQNFVNNFRLGDDNFIFCCTGSRDDYFGSVGWQNINNNLKFQGRHI